MRILAGRKCILRQPESSWQGPGQVSRARRVAGSGAGLPRETDACPDHFAIAVVGDRCHVKPFAAAAVDVGHLHCGAGRTGRWTRIPAVGRGALQPPWMESGPAEASPQRTRPSIPTFHALHNRPSRWPSRCPVPAEVVRAAAPVGDGNQLSTGSHCVRDRVATGRSVAGCPDPACAPRAQLCHLDSLFGRRQNSGQYNPNRRLGGCS